MKILLPLALASSLACGGSKATVPPRVAPPPPPPPGMSESASKNASIKSSPAWGPCYRGFAPATQQNGEPGAESARLAGMCAQATGMHRVAGPFAGKQGAGEAAQAFPFRAEAGHCYRAYVVAAGTVKDISLFVKDSAGIVLAEDTEPAPFAVDLPAGAVCFHAAEQASVVVSIGGGSGPYSVEVWSN